MTGGTITTNTANTEGGGVRVEDGVFNMTGGEITDNLSTSMMEEEPSPVMSLPLRSRLTSWPSTTTENEDGTTTSSNNVQLNEDVQQEEGEAGIVIGDGQDYCTDAKDPAAGLTYCRCNLVPWLCAAALSDGLPAYPAAGLT